MKKLLLLLLLPSVCFAEYEFSVGATNYRLLESTVSGQYASGKFFITALWDVKTPKASWRWTTHTSACDQPIGNIAIIMEGGVEQKSWSWEGDRAYDWIAAASCFVYTSKNPKAKPVK